MFDIAFSELVVIAVVALIVIGPERLPKVARTLGHMLGRLQRYVNDVKADINREMQLDELRKLGNEVQSAAQELHTSVTDAARNVEGGVRSLEAQLNEAGAVDAAVSAAMPETSMAPLTATAPDATAPAAAPTTASNIAAATSADGEPPRQPALPGFDRI